MSTITKNTGNKRAGFIKMLGAGLFLSMLLLVGCISIETDGDHSDGTADENQKHTFAVGANPTIDVDGFNGSIEIIAGPDGEVDVVSTLTIPGRISYSATVDGNIVNVVARRTGSGITIGRSPSVKITMIVPAHSVIRAHTSNGSIKVTGISGTGQLDTSNGNIVINNVVGQYDSSTSNGSLTFTNVSGQFTGESSNGKIKFSGSFDANSENKFKTSNGSIDIVFTGDPDVELDARTSNGTVNSDRPILAITTSRSHLVGKYGDGFATLEIRTSNGSIDIR
jgi:hypothetical protein